LNLFSSHSCARLKCIGIDERSGKVRLSRKAAMKERESQKQGGEAAPAADAPATQ
jgi:polyribonucleotide nucleotidyltransferase